MTRELLVVKNNSGQLELFPKADDAQNVDRNEYVSALITNATNVVFVFKSPADLEEVIAHHAGDAAIKGSTNMTSFDRMRKLRLEIFSSIPDGTILTDAEEAGYETGPFIAPLYQAWRRAFAKVPQEHPVQEVEFDMCVAQSFKDLQMTATARLLQHISTVLYLRSSSPVCCRVGRSRSNKIRTWLQGALLKPRATTTSEVGPIL